MSTYAVFGMTPSYAKEEAKKKVESRVPINPNDTSQGYRDLSLEEYQKALDKYVSDLMESRRVVKLSTMFDAPQFAREFKSIAAKNGGRDLTVKAYIAKKDGSGKELRNPKTGRLYMEWQAA